MKRERILSTTAAGGGPRAAAASAPATWAAVWAAAWTNTPSPVAREWQADTRSHRAMVTPTTTRIPAKSSRYRTTTVSWRMKISNSSGRLRGGVPPRSPTPLIMSGPTAHEPVQSLLIASPCVTTCPALTKAAGRRPARTASPGGAGGRRSHTPSSHTRMPRGSHGVTRARLSQPSLLVRRPAASALFPELFLDDAAHRPWVHGHLTADSSGTRLATTWTLPHMASVGAGPAEYARRAGQSIEVLFRHYAKFLDGLSRRTASSSSP